MARAKSRPPLHGASTGSSLEGVQGMATLIKDTTMDAITLLTNDHDTVEALLTELAESTPRGVKKRTELLEKIRVELKAHTTIEEEIFYPAFKEHGDQSDDDKMYFEALEEHRAAGELVLPDLLGTDVASEKFSGRAKVLKELVQHHADEEEKEMFPRAKKLLSKDELATLGEQMASRKSELVKELKAAT
jgi:hemerythrin superfamily protein